LREIDDCKAKAEGTMADHRKLINSLQGMTVEGIVMQSESKLRQLAVDLKLIIYGDKITMDALKGKVISHMIEQNLCKPSGRGRQAGSTTEAERNVTGNTDRRGMGDAAMDGEIVQQ
jgi:hypothetical protein